MMPDMDFSRINLQYFVLARDLATRNPALTGTLLGLSDEMAKVLTRVTPEALSHISKVQAPLLEPRSAPWLWERLFIALAEGRESEIDVVLSQSAFVNTWVDGE